MKVYLGIPSHSRTLDFGTAQAVMFSGCSDLVLSFKATSLLPWCFNSLLCDAYNKREELGLTHFCMLHSDVEPEHGWLGKMLEILAREKVDVLSVLIPQKTGSGVTSTAIERQGMPYKPRRLTMRECDRMPKTFLCNGLLINTGCLLLRMGAIDPERHFFEFKDQVTKVNGRYVPECQPEDWGFSRKLAADGILCAVTREVKVTHYGAAGWSNQGTWGEDTDPVKVTL